MNKQTINLSILFFVVYFGLGSFLPFNSIYLKDTLGYNGNQIGLFYSLSALIVTFSVPFFGILADKIRSLKKVLIFCSLTTFIFFIPYTILKPFFIITTLYIIINAIRSAILPILDTMAIDHSMRTNFNYGIFRAIAPAAFIIASIIMGLLLDKFPNFTNIFIYSQMLMLLLSSYFGFKHESKYSSSKSSEYLSSDLKKLIKNKEYLILIIIMALSFATIQASQSFISLSISELGGQNNVIGLSILFLALPEVILCSFVLKITKKVKHTTLMLIAVIFLLLRWIVLFFTNSILLFLFVSSSHGFIMAFVILVGMDLIKKIVKPSLISSALSLYTGLSSCILALISLLAGFIMNNHSIKSTYILYFATTFIVIIAILVYMIKFKEEENYE